MNFLSLVNAYLNNIMRMVYAFAVICRNAKVIDLTSMFFFVVRYLKLINLFAIKKVNEHNKTSCLLLQSVAVAADTWHPF